MMYEMEDFKALALDVQDSLNRLETLIVSGLPEEVDEEELLQLMGDLNDAKRQMKEIYEEAELQAVKKLKGVDRPVQLDGFVAELKTGSERKSWDHADLRETVARRISEQAIDMDTGEVTMSPREMITAALQCAGVGYWKVKELKKLGLDADDYAVSKIQKQQLHLAGEKHDTRRHIAGTFRAVRHSVERSLNKGGANLTYIPVSEVITRLNKVFGVTGWNYTIQNVYRDGIDEDHVLAHVRLTVHGDRQTDQHGYTVDAPNVTRDGFGGVKIKRTRNGDPVDLGDEFKGAVSDALKKAAQSLGCCHVSCSW